MGNIAARFRVSFAIAVLLAVSSAATAADYPRRIAIAPFTILGSHEDIRQTVDILPRLISSRLMAMTGAEVGDSPRGGVCRGCRETSRPAAITQGVGCQARGRVQHRRDRNRPDHGADGGRLFRGGRHGGPDHPPSGGPCRGHLGKVVRGEGGRSLRTAPGILSCGSASRRRRAAHAIRCWGNDTNRCATRTGSRACSATGHATAEKRVGPSSFTKVAQTTKIPDEIYGVVAGNIDSEGNGEVIAYGKQTIYIYRVKGEEILPYTRVSRTIHDHILSIDAVDLDEDERKDSSLQT